MLPLSVAVSHHSFGILFSLGLLIVDWQAVKQCNVVGGRCCLFCCPVEQTSWPAERGSQNHLGSTTAVAERRMQLAFWACILLFFFESCQRCCKGGGLPLSAEFGVPWEPSSSCESPAVLWSSRVSRPSPSAASHTPLFIYFNVSWLKRDCVFNCNENSFSFRGGIRKKIYTVCVNLL